MYKGADFWECVQGHWHVSSSSCTRTLTCILILMY